MTQQVVIPAPWRGEGLAPGLLQDKSMRLPLPLGLCLLAGCEGIATTAPSSIAGCPTPAVAEHTQVHRLTATEYDNTVQALLGVRSSAATAFPPQPAGPSGYTNDSTSLGVSAELVSTLYTQAEAASAAVLASKGTAGGAYARLAPCAGGFLPGQLASAQQKACLGSVIAALGPRAYRRPLGSDELAQLTAAASASGDFDTALNDLVQTVLMSPHFLFVTVVGPQSTDPQARFALTPHQLASRLSYFLWQSMPDEELFARAADGTLVRPDVLQAQVARMLASPASAPLRRTLRDEYAGLARLDAAPVQNVSEPLRLAMIAETDAFLADLFAADRPVADVVGARRTFANQVLAQHYGLTFPAGTDPATMVAFTGDQTDRAGLGSQAAVLVATAGDINFTHPVKRGHFVADRMLCSPPPAPPPNIPSIDPNPSVGGTPREKLAAHVNNPACSGCHQVMDELGLGLENYDPQGRWRTTYPGLSAPIDASGTLPGGTGFKDAREMFQQLAARDSTGMCVAQNLMKLALQSPVATPNARCAQLQVAQAAKGGTVSTLVKALATSAPFLQQAGEAP